MIAKNPDQYKGQTYLIFGEVTQFDSATGVNRFRANVSNANTCSYGFFRGDNTILVKGPGADLTNVVNDDVFAAKVTVLGSTSYSTTLGGGTTVPELQVDSIELQGRCES